MPDEFYRHDPWLEPYYYRIREWQELFLAKKNRLSGKGNLSDFASGHLYYGMHHSGTGLVFREWAPNARDIYLVGTFNNWEESDKFRLKRLNEEGDWEIKLTANSIAEGDYYKLSIHWDGGSGERIPSYSKMVVQDNDTKLFTSVHWLPPKKYKWKNKRIKTAGQSPFIYEAHVGMSSEEEKVSSFDQFRKEVLPRIAANGYNTLQLMAIQEHPYYGSFGYHVSNFFAVSSRFGNPDQLKALVDEAHAMGISVIIDLVHSHSVKNTNEGLGLFDGNPGQYFHAGPRRLHEAWDSFCFDYGKDHVIHYLLSNCRYWIEEYMIDGFRFDGVTSMLYYDHGLNRNFTSYEMYFDGNQDVDAVVYLKLANTLIHELNPDAITIAEEMSGMPGTASPIENDGLGFDFRLNMGAPDYWIKTIKEKRDEEWNVDDLFYELIKHRVEEKTITYCESHDQALVGDKTLMFRLADSAMYTSMSKNAENLVIDRAIALHKLIRLFTLSTGQSGYLNFMGNEFGHPEWIDFPREGNSWSYRYARRQWSLADNTVLKYHYLNDFDRDMISFARDNSIFKNTDINRIYSSTNDSIIAFTRGDMLFVFNFHPGNSYSDYRIPIAGRYKLILNTDNNTYGGFNRVKGDMLYISSRRKEAPLSEPPSLPLYLPSRCGLIFKSQPVKRINQSI